MGRHESEEEAQEVRKMLCRTFEKYNVKYENYVAGLESYDKIVNVAVDYLNELRISRTETANKARSIRKTVNSFN